MNDTSENSLNGRPCSAPACATSAFRRTWSPLVRSPSHRLLLCRIPAVQNFIAHRENPPYSPLHGSSSLNSSGVRSSLVIGGTKVMGSFCHTDWISTRLCWRCSVGSCHLRTGQFDSER